MHDTILKFAVDTQVNLYIWTRLDPSCQKGQISYLKIPIARNFSYSQSKLHNTSAFSLSRSFIIHKWYGSSLIFLRLNTAFPAVEGSSPEDSLNTRGWLATCLSANDVLPFRSVYDFRDPEAQVPEKKSANCKCVTPLLKKKEIMCGESSTQRDIWKHWDHLLEGKNRTTS